MSVGVCYINLSSTPFVCQPSWFTSNCYSPICSRDQHDFSLTTRKDDHSHIEMESLKTDQNHSTNPSNVEVPRVTNSSTSTHCEKEHTSHQIIHIQRRAYPLTTFQGTIHPIKHMKEVFEHACVKVIEEKTESISNVLGTLLDELFKSQLEKKQLTRKDINKIKNSMFSTAFPKQQEIYDGFKIDADKGIVNNCVQGFSNTDKGNIEFTTDWIAIVNETGYVSKPMTAICVLKNSEVRLDTLTDDDTVKLVILLLIPEQHSVLFSPAEILRTYGTVLSYKSRSDPNTCLEKVITCDLEEEVLLEFRKTVAVLEHVDQERAEKMEKREHHIDHRETLRRNKTLGIKGMDIDYPWWHFGKGVYNDFEKRYSFYLSDWTDAFYDRHDQTPFEIKKLFRDFRVLRGTLYVFITIVIPALTYGIANAKNTSKSGTDHSEAEYFSGYISVGHTLLAHAIAGILFAFFSTQPLGLVMSTPPITLIIYLIFKIHKTLDNTKFLPFYALTGVFIGLDLIILSLLNSYKLLKYITPSIEEVFAIFTAYGYLFWTLEAIVDISKTWFAVGSNEKDKYLLWILYVLVTSFIALFLWYGFQGSNLFSRSFRETIRHYSLLLAIALIVQGDLFKI